MQTEHSISRRSALAASAAALVAGTIPATADAERAEWLGLWDAYEAQERRHVAGTDAYFEAEWQARQNYPPQQVRSAETWFGAGSGKPLGWHLRQTVNLPDPITKRPRRRTVTRDDIDEHYQRMLGSLKGPAPEGGPTMQNTATLEDVNAHWSQSLADLDAWEAECRAVDARSNVPALKAAHEAEYGRYMELERAIVEKPATGLLGVAVKLALWARTELTSTLECAGGEDHEEGQQWLAGPAVAAWRDALRLAVLTGSDGHGAEGVGSWLTSTRSWRLRARFRSSGFTMSIPTPWTRPTSSETG